MITLPGYQAVEKLSENSRSLIYRSRRTADNTPVILKTLRQEYPSPQEMARLEREYEILCSLKVEGVIRAYGLEYADRTVFMVLEDFGGKSLQDWLQERRFNLEECLNLAIKLTSIVGEIHRQQIVHKDLNPSNILFNPIAGQIKIIDFGIASRRSRSTPSFRNPLVLEGTLAYMSPEQTGRMNRSIDYRTDFYSLGVIFYQLLCDRLPFSATNPLELVHCHLAQEPIFPSEIDAAIPPTVSAIVMKLLAKNPEERYQSTRGILTDIQDCLDRWESTQQILPFPIGRGDISGKLRIPEKLYGRERELEQLLAAVTRIFSEENVHSELILVSGNGGIGKTKLVRELYPAITQQQGYFVAGKYEQFAGNIPYSGVVQALGELVCQVLTESKDRLDRWREQLTIALGDNGRVLIDMIPELELLIGTQPEVVELAPDRARNRFQWVVERFLDVFLSSPDSSRDRRQPTIIFLDDLQWADRASWQLIQHWLTVFKERPLLLIGTYRDNEVDITHILTKSIAEIQTAVGIIIDRVLLAPLGLADIDRLLRDTFHCDAVKSLPLAELIYQKTEGNPFFINELLQFLDGEGSIYFDEIQGCWDWNLSAIRTMPLTDNLAKLVTVRMQQLPLETKEILSLGACFGSQFNLEAVVVVSEQLNLSESLTHSERIASFLQPAIQANLIIPIEENENYPRSRQHHSQLPTDINYRFLHDLIRQTAYEFIPAERQKIYHLAIGKYLLQSTASADLEANIFAIVDHLNLATDLIGTTVEKHQLARLNLIAGKKAKTAIAYGAALKYLNIGRSLLTADSWQTDYELTLDLTGTTASAAYLAGNFERMEELVHEVLDRARTPVEKTQVYLVKIQAFIAQEKFLEAIQIALQALEILNIHIPAQPDKETIDRGLLETRQIALGMPLENLLDLPSMTAPDKLAAMQIIASVCTPTYFLAPELWQLMVCQKIQLSINYGNAPGSAFGYADYGLIQCAVEKNIDRGYKFAQLASQLQPQLNAKDFIAKTSLLVNMYLNHWREHLKETLEPLRDAYNYGLETGDLEYGVFAIVYRFYHSYSIGRELHQLDREMASYESEIERFNQIIPLHLTRLYRQVVVNLIEPSEDSISLVGNSYNERETLPQLLAANDKYLLFHLYLHKLILAYLFQDHELAAESAQTTGRLLSEGAVGLLLVPIFYFYDSLAKIANFPALSPAEQQQTLITIDANCQKMQHWAERAPMNYLHKFYLMAAERNRILGEDLAAIDAYDRAIDLAQTNGYLNEEALANELAGRYYLSKGKPKIARAYLWDARHCYLRWGAIAKVHHLDRLYPQFFDRLPDPNPDLFNRSHSLPNTSSNHATQPLDIAALMKASQVLASEIVLEKLLTKLIAIAIENAGAQRGYLLLEQQGQLQIVAETDTVLPAIPITSPAAAARLPVAMINYVARTHTSIVLDRATEDYRFDRDPYIRQHQLKSILCTPLLSQGKLSGILYLENNLTTDAFTPERLEIVQFLSTQAAISLDNARLYNQLELRVQERTAELTHTNECLQTEILERQRSEQTLQTIVEGTAPVTGVDFFRSLVRSLAQALSVRYAFISECLDAPPTRVRSFAFWNGNNFGDEFEYDLHGTPCEQIVNDRGYRCFPDRIQALFPAEKEELEAMSAKSYAGVPLLDSTNNLLGHLAILDDQPMIEEARIQAVLEIFAARAAAEMERKQAEDALRESETKFATAFRSSPEAITICTLEEECYIEVNDSCLQMLGYSREETIGRTASELKIWTDATEKNEIDRLLQQQGTVSNLEVKLRRKSGEIFPALYSAEVIYLEDEPCLLAVTADITTIKQAEKALERLAEIGELTATIVHEVRNPLTTISMGLNAFKRLELDARFQEYLSLSLDEAERLQRLLNQILLYSRQQTLDRVSIELNSFTAATLEPLTATSAALDKEIRLLTTPTPIEVLADRDKLKQVLINLVTNACEAVSNGEIITVEIQQPTPDKVHIQIHNGGNPIPPDILPKLTKPFFTTKPSGTGLGLAIVKRIVEAHDGEFSIESSADLGTIVRVKLAVKG